MNLLVCVKQTPDMADARLDPETGRLSREGTAALNPYDACALEAAARIRDRLPDAGITALAMGPESAAGVLRECLAAAADRAWLICDSAFQGSDTLATSYILACAIQRLEASEGRFDAILCGKQTADGGCGHVGPQLAEYLDRPLVGGALECIVEKDCFEVLREGPENMQVIGVEAPCVLTFTKTRFDLRFPTIKRKLAAKRAEIPTLTAADLTGLDVGRVGAEGALTRVKRVYAPERPRSVTIIKEGAPAEKAAGLAELLWNARMI